MRLGKASLALTLALAGCATPPAPVVAPPPPAPLIAAPPPARGATDWRDIPETPGSWGYARAAAGSTATFTEAGGVADFVIQCDPASRRITLARPGATAAITLTTSYAAKNWPTSPVILAATDPVLDQIAFTRGRFTVETPGLTKLILPAWAEPARVIEDCRG